MGQPASTEVSSAMAEIADTIRETVNDFKDQKTQQGAQAIADRLDSSVEKNLFLMGTKEYQFVLGYALRYEAKFCDYYKAVIASYLQLHKAQGFAFFNGNTVLAAARKARNIDLVARHVMRLWQAKRESVSADVLTFTRYNTIADDNIRVLREHVKLLQDTYDNYKSLQTEQKNTLEEQKKLYLQMRKDNPQSFRNTDSPAT
jgi:hypothetical protein